MHDALKERNRHLRKAHAESAAAHKRALNGSRSELRATTATTSPIRFL